MLGHRLRGLHQTFLDNPARGEDTCVSAPLSESALLPIIAVHVLGRLQQASGAALARCKPQARARRRPLPLHAKRNLSIRSDSQIADRIAVISEGSSTCSDMRRSLI